MRSNRTLEAHADVIIDADVATVWAALTDWRGQSRWMMATHVDEVVGRPGKGQRFVAVTGIGRISVMDELVVSVWEPPHCVEVLHVGKRIRGSGEFEVFSLPGGRSRVQLTERIEPPGGLLGEMCWPAIRIGFEWGAKRSLQSLRRIVEGADSAGS